MVSPNVEVSATPLHVERRRRVCFNKNFEGVRLKMQFFLYQGKEHKANKRKSQQIYYHPSTISYVLRNCFLHQFCSFTQ